MSDTEGSTRIDKWLWFARFFKSRSLAVEAVKAGHVQVNGVRAKPGKSVKAGDEVALRKSPYDFTLTVRDPGQRRGSAPEAQKLYEEHPDSIAAREKLAAQLKASHSVVSHAGRLTKKDRRDFERDRRRAYDDD